MVFFNSSNARRLTVKRELCHMWNIPRPITKKKSRGLRNSPRSMIEDDRHVPNILFTDANG